MSGKIVGMQILDDLEKILEMYFDEEEKSYEEYVASSLPKPEEHIFHNLLNIYYYVRSINMRERGDY